MARNYAVSIPYPVFAAAKRPVFEAERKAAAESEKRYGLNRRGNEEPEEYELNLGKVDNADLTELAEVAATLKLGPAEKTIRAILAARNNDFDKVVPNFKAFMPMLTAYLQFEATDGWIYVTNPIDGFVYPELVIDVLLNEPRDGGTPSIQIRTIAYGKGSGRRQDSGMTVIQATHGFDPSDVARRRVSDTLLRAGIQKETPELRAAYDAEMERHYKLVRAGFAQQFIFEGKFTDGGDYRWRSSQKPVRRKVIHDLAPDDFEPIPLARESKFYDDDSRPVPEHATVRVFDLSDHEYLWGNSGSMKPYVYDKTLRDKLVLPASHRDLLDVMTTDLDAFLGDIIEGKSAGNIILCKGIPGVGKTLTAEIYSEIIEKPLYSVRSGALGTTAAAIESNLKELFGRQKRWGCILLLDEADVFVGERGDNIEKNAIVAEFLRVLEYFDGLLFMTTNRPNDIDEAIISRCAAVISYEVPDDTNRMKVWLVLLTNYGVKEIRPSLLSDLVEVFPTITPRDTKMLLRLALRVAKFHNEELSIDIFRRCAMFRAIEVKDIKTASEMV